MTKEQIGSFVLDERKKQKLSQQALADKADFSRYQQILEIEKGSFDYGVDKLISVMNALNVTLVFTGTGQDVLKYPLTTDDMVPILFDFSKAQPAKEEDDSDKPVEKKKQVKKTPTATFKKTNKK
jgi:transcriptional regulator with XRE-family HTH domain